MNSIYERLAEIHGCAAEDVEAEIAAAIQRGGTLQTLLCRGSGVRCHGMGKTRRLKKCCRTASQKHSGERALNK